MVQPQVFCMLSLGKTAVFPTDLFDQLYLQPFSRFSLGITDEHEVQVVQGVQEIEECYFEQYEISAKATCNDC